MDTVRLAFSDQLPNFDPHRNFWLEQWRKFADVEVVENSADAQVLMYSDWGRDHQGFKGLKIYHTGENMFPDFQECDLAFTSMNLPDEPRNIRLPIYFFYVNDPTQLIKPDNHDAAAVLAQKTGFCNFLVSNPRSPIRNTAFKKLNARKRVDSGGKHFNNLGYRVDDKLAFVGKYKFTLAFENSATPGYTTEKLLEPMLANSIPIYWGNPDVANEFNPRSFICADQFASVEALIDYILEVDQDDGLYLQYVRQPWLHDNKLTEIFSRERIREALQGFWLNRPQQGIRRYRHRALRAHIYANPLDRFWSSFRCRLESAHWRFFRSK